MTAAFNFQSGQHSPTHCNSITWPCAQVNFVSDAKQYQQITVMVWVQFTAFTCSAEYTRLWSSAAGISLLLSSFFCLSSALVAELHKFYFVWHSSIACSSGGTHAVRVSIRAQDGGAQRDCKGLKISLSSYQATHAHARVVADRSTT